MAIIGFDYGALSDKLEKQANDQGYTLGDKQELLEKLAFGLIINNIHGTLTDSAYQRALEKLHKMVMATIKPLEGKD